YPDGRVCISILHAPGDDLHGYELSNEQCMPGQPVESIVLSPNDASLANAKAAIEWYA
ncbi:hypothetical protein MKW98_015236, partial [Papaver atlanticum]